MQYLQQLKSWFRNTSKKAMGLQGPRTKDVLSSAFQTVKKTRMHKPEEIYQSLYKDKIDALMKIEVEQYHANNKDQHIGTQAQRGTEDNKLESDGEDMTIETVDEPQKTGKERALDKGTKAFKSWHMSTRRRVVKEAWENETTEVKEIVMKEIEAERKTNAELVDDQKTGMDRTPEQRQL